MPETQDTFVHRWFEEVWNKGRAAAIDEMLAPGAVVHGIKGPDGAELRGPAGFKPFFEMFRAAFPDIHVEVEETIIDGEKFSGRCVARGTHKGPLGGFPATQKQIEFSGMCMAVVRDGKMTEVWNTWDFVTMYRQLGALTFAEGIL